MKLTKDREQNVKAVQDSGWKQGVAANSDIEGACTHKSVNALAINDCAKEDDKTDHLELLRNNAGDRSVT
jgi:hypothetical protein